VSFVAQSAIGGAGLQARVGGRAAIRDIVSPELASSWDGGIVWRCWLSSEAPTQFWAKLIARSDRRNFAKRSFAIGLFTNSVQPEQVVAATRIQRSGGQSIGHLGDLSNLAGCRNPYYHHILCSSLVGI
jgi:hypothetical protein